MYERQENEMFKGTSGGNISSGLVLVVWVGNDDGNDTGLHRAWGSQMKAFGEWDGG